MIVKNYGDSNPDDNDYCQMNKDRCWSWVRCNIYNISMKQDCLRRTYTFLACWTNRFVTCHFIFSLLSFLFLFILVGERGLLHVIHLFLFVFYFYYSGSTGLLFPSPWKARNESEKVKVFPNFSRQEKLFCCQTSRAESYLVAPLYLDIRYYFGFSFGTSGYPHSSVSFGCKTNQLSFVALKGHLEN